MLRVPEDMVTKISPMNTVWGCFLGGIYRCLSNHPKSPCRFPHLKPYDGSLLHRSELEFAMGVAIQLNCWLVPYVKSIEFDASLSGAKTCVFDSFTGDDTAKRRQQTVI